MIDFDAIVAPVTFQSFLAMTVEAPERVFTDGILMAVFFIRTFIDILAVFYAGIFTCQTSFTLTLIKPRGIFTCRVQSTCGHSCLAFIFICALQSKKETTVVYKRA